MTKEEYKRHQFGAQEMVMHEGKPAEVISAGEHSVSIRIGWKHYKTVLPEDIELMGDKEEGVGGQNL